MASFLGARSPWLTVITACIALMVLRTGAGRVQSHAITAAYDPLRTTFAGPADLSLATASGLIGRWQAGDTALVLLPRVPFGGQRLATLYGAIPNGAYEGVLSIWQEPEGRWQGFHVPVSTLQRRDVMATPAADGRGLQIAIAGRTPLALRRTGGVDVALPHAVNIICHRGLSLGRSELMNSLAGIRLSALFGCSGVELDVTVPHDERRAPVLSPLRIHHPPEWRSEITGFDSAPAASLAGAPTVPEALRAAQEAGAALVYLDPKLQWLVKRNHAAARAALSRIAAEAAAQLATDPNQTIVIGSSTDGPAGAATIMAALRSEGRWPEHLLWALELTRGTADVTALARVEQNRLAERPDIVSFNLLRLQGGGGGWLRGFVPTIVPRIEHGIGAASQPLIYWTAHDESQFAGAINAHARMRRSAPGTIGIITSVPHRLAFHLATGASARR